MAAKCRETISSKLTTSSSDRQYKSMAGAANFLYRALHILTSCVHSNEFVNIRGWGGGWLSSPFQNFGGALAPLAPTLSRHLVIQRALKECSLTALVASITRSRRNNNFPIHLPSRNEGIFKPD